ncbi:MAG: hypothetical protein ACOYON_15935 [Fimbriimonas sp.]
MKQRREDEIIGVAFGDSSAPQHLDRDEEAVFSQLSWIKDGLKDLREIPEDQISTERLRDAILSSGLRPEPVAPRWGWLWMPLTAAMAAVVFLQVQKSMARVEPQLMVQEPVAQAEPFRLKVPSTASDILAKTPPKSVAVNSPAPSRRVRNPISRETAVSLEVEGPKMTLAYAPQVSNLRDRAEEANLGSRGGMRAAKTAPSMSADAMAASPVEEESTVILIQSEKDANTGLPIATEVNSTKNVLVGG